jgi:hypothetical protein
MLPEEIPLIGPAVDAFLDAFADFLTARFAIYYHSFITSSFKYYL